jgi:hypothetical protein
MANGAIWIGLVEVKPVRDDEPRWRDHFGPAAGGFANPVAFATDASGFQQAIAAALREVGGEAVSFEDVETLQSRRAQMGDSDLFSGLAAELERSGQPQLGSFHLFGAEEFESSAKWLESQSERGDLTKLQSQTLREIGRMLGRLDLPLLGGVSLASEEARVIVNLTHGTDGHPDLGVSIGEDDVVVEYGLGHAHFGGAVEEKTPLGDANSFIFSALQGGVKIEVWEKPGGTIDRTRTSILAVDGTWDPLTTVATNPSVSFDTSPTYTRVLSFASPSSDA